MLSTGATDLNVVFSGDGLKSGPVGHEVRKVDVDGSAECGSEVGGAGCDVTQVVVVSETSNTFNELGGSGETLEDGADIGTLLHGDDTELILFVDPDEECLGSVVEDTTSLGPVTVKTASIEETVTLSIFKKGTN